MRALDVHAKDLKGSGQRGVVLEGHTDERGTREYNMALGERRAKAVQRYLVLQGVSPAQLELVSYGKERPVATGHDEQSWAPEPSRRAEEVSRYAQAPACPDVPRAQPAIRGLGGSSCVTALPPTMAATFLLRVWHGRCRRRLCRRWG